MHTYHAHMWGEYVINNPLDVESSDFPADTGAAVERRWGRMAGPSTWSQQLPGSFLVVAPWVAAPQGTGEVEEQEKLHSLQPK